MNRPALAAVAALLLVLTACATPDPQPTTPPVTEPSASPTAAPVSAPQPLYEITCDAVAPAGIIAPLSAKPLVARHPMVIDDTRWELGIDQYWTLRTAQATDCLWTNGEPMHDADGQPSEAYTSLSIRALPDGKDAWATWVSGYGEKTTYCVGEGPDYSGVYCEWNGLVDGTTFLNITFDGLKDAGTDAKNAARIDALAAEVAANLASSDTGERWTQPSDTQVIAKTCPSVLSAAAVASALGVDAKTINFFDGSIGGTALPFETELMIDSDPCRWGSQALSAEYGHPVQILRGGEWAWGEARSDASLGSNVSTALPLGVTGLADGDTAWKRTSSTVPAADLIIGGNWISIALTPDEAPSAETEALLLRLAQSIVDELTS